MIILKNQFNKNDTVIFGDVVSNKTLGTFHISQLGKMVKLFSIPSTVKSQILSAFSDNQNKDDLESDVSAMLFEHNNSALTRAVALATQNQQLMQMLVVSPDELVRIALARRTDLSDKLIEQLSKDDSINVRMEIARQANLPQSVIKTLAEDLDPVSEIIAMRTDLTDDIIEYLASNYSFAIRQKVVENSKLPAHLVEKLSNDQDYLVRKALAKHHALTDAIIEKLSRDEYFGVRKAIAEKQSLTQEIVKRLSQDEDERVRQAIKDRESK